MIIEANHGEWAVHNQILKAVNLFLVTPGRRSDTIQLTLNQKKIDNNNFQR
jgi:hypothetical protein